MRHEVGGTRGVRVRVGLSVSALPEGNEAGAPASITDSRGTLSPDATDELRKGSSGTGPPPRRQGEDRLV